VADAEQPRAAQAPGPDDSIGELKALIQEIQERVRARHATTAEGKLALPDLLPVLHARDAAQGKVASIGSVNPRPGGPVNALIQSWKRLVARTLNWFVPEQVEFNRGAVEAIEALLRAMEENNRALAELARRIEAFRQAGILDLKSYWDAWHTEWERKLAVNETQFLRGVADLQTAFLQRTARMETNSAEMSRSLHRDFTLALEKSGLEIQQRLWTDLERIRLQYEEVIHHELRLLRQKAWLALPAAAVPSPVAGPPPPMDWLKFAEKFRGSEESIRKRQGAYVEKFRGCRNVLDLGCGRGEFLEAMCDAGIPSTGVELSQELVALCRQKGLQAEQADMFQHLDCQPDGSIDGIFCAQVVEHLPPARVPELLRLMHAKLRQGGVALVETPNPECLAIFATHFYLDPTHQRPLPPALLTFYFEEAGFGRIEVVRLSPAEEEIPELKEMPAGLRQRFFGPLDYAVTGRRL